ncbi:hypothetical protein MKEN_01450800 [Mycena kentingensis (nom. inval.)]|nr:hypothetical protein MKEN_01450800 [Mycena kentingensis (nom. inval.)]
MALVRCGINDAPNEILLLICRELSRGTLATLCRTSRALLGAAQYILYLSVTIADSIICAPSRLRSWCLAINAHPHLAARVQSLALHLPNLGSLPESLSFDDAQQLQTALQRCIRLQRLAIFKVDRSARRGCNAAWLLRGCAFRLHGLINEYFALDDDFASFLSKQTELRRLSLDYIERTCTGARYLGAFSSEAMPVPNVTIASVPDERDLRPEWRLERLEIAYRVTSNDALRLQDYARTLTVLNIFTPENWRYSRVCLADSVDLISELLPNLVHFAAVDMISLNATLLHTLSPHVSVARFQRLKTLTLMIWNNVLSFSSEYDANGWPSGRQYHVNRDVNVFPDAPSSGMEALVEHTAQACKSLQRVIIGTFDPVSRKHLKYVAKRDAKGRISVTTEAPADKFDFLSVSQFGSE